MPILRVAKTRRRALGAILLAPVLSLLVLVGCTTEPQSSNEKVDTLRDAIISKDCDVTATPPSGVSLDQLFRNETSSTGDASTDTMIADYAQYWQRYYLALQALDIEGSCVLVNSSSSRFRGQGFVQELKANKERFDGYARLLSVRVTRFEESEAELTACIDESGLQRIDEDGNEVGERAGIVAIDSHLVHADGLWRVGDNKQNPDYSCE